MVRHALAGAFVLGLWLAAAATTLGAATTPRAMYVAALERERTIRAALADPQADVALLKDIRAVIAAYEAIVRRYPGSGYSANALWQAGRLSLDAFGRFSQAQDKAAAIRVLRSLATRYPTSRLGRRVPEALDGLDAPVMHRATIKDVRRVVLPDAVRVTIELDAEVPFHEEHLDDPSRVFLDLPSTRAAPSLIDQTLRFNGDNDVVRHVRIGRHPNNITRVVLDTVGVLNYSVYALYNPYRLVIDCARSVGLAGAVAPAAPMTALPMTAPATTTTTVTTPVATTPRNLRARRFQFDWGRRLPAGRPRATALLAAAASAAPNIDALATPGVAPSLIAAAAPPEKNLAGGFSIARQLGLSVSRIVIDPGHGGHDPGAKGPGVTEAELVLDLALRLEALLRKIPGIEVILTRRGDEFISLQERTAIANREGADLFLSIHANASPSAQARGIETYFLNFASNLSAAAVAARENAASGQAMGALPDLVKAIALNNKLDESRDLATEVQRALIGRLRGANKTLRDLGVKQAPFVVLIGAAMPSVLAEIAFVTNPQEARLLRGSAYRQRIAEALLAAIRKYQTSLKNVTAVAHQ